MPRLGSLTDHRNIVQRRPHSGDKHGHYTSFIMVRQGRVIMCDEIAVGYTLPRSFTSHQDGRCDENREFRWWNKWTDMINDRDLSREKLILATDSQTQAICTRLGLSRLCHRFLGITFVCGCGSGLFPSYSAVATPWPWRDVGDYYTWSRMKPHCVRIWSF